MKKTTKMILGLITTVGLLTSGLFVMSIEGWTSQTQMINVDGVREYQGNS